MYAHRQWLSCWSCFLENFWEIKYFIRLTPLPVGLGGSHACDIVMLRPILDINCHIDISHKGHAQE
jgi:hypothetical protein